MAFRFRPVFGNGNLSPFFYQLYKFYLRTVKYRYEFVHCHVAVSSVKLAANVLQLGEVADLKAQMFNLLQMFISITNVQFSTEPAILPNCC